MRVSDEYTDTSQIKKHAKTTLVNHTYLSSSRRLPGDRKCEIVRQIRRTNEYSSFYYHKISELERWYLLTRHVHSYTRSHLYQSFETSTLSNKH